MLTVALGVVAFTGVVLLLVALLLVARAGLAPAGESQIQINDDPERLLRVHSGRSLMTTLAEQAIYVPSGCGGRGTCGTCRIRIESGGGPLLPTEAGLLTPREARDGWRLACQVKVRGDLWIRVPPEILGVRSRGCRVRSNRSVATFIKELVLDLGRGEDLAFRAGAYVQVICPPHTVAYRDFDIDAAFRDEWDRYDMWRFVSRVDEETTRAYSLANPPHERGVIKLNVRIAPPPPGRPDVPPGKVSSWLFALKPGDVVSVAGPFGEFFARETENEMCFVGGGAGMAPMRAHILDQFERLRTDRKVSFWYGARSLREAFYQEEFDALAREHPNFSWHLVLSEPKPEDRWTGLTGFVHQALYDNYLKDHPAPEDVEYYLCGPALMIEACTQMLSELGVEPENVLFDNFG